MLAARSLRLAGSAALLLALSLGAAAKERHVSHHHHHHGHAHDYQDRAEPEPDLGARAAPGAHAPGGGFGLAAAQLIRACSGQAAELQKMPFDVVVNTVRPNDDQRAALEKIRAAAADAVKKLNANCPKDVPAPLAGQLDSIRASLDAIKSALQPLRPVFVSAYAVLDDEQKARLVALAISQQQAENPHQGATQAAQGAAAVTSAAETQEEPVALGCRQWPARLKSWPLSRIESDLSLSDDQHAALYSLMAAIYRAAGGVVASCHEENWITPVARLDAELIQVDALRQCVDTITPALTGFAKSLSDEQTGQLNTALGLSAKSAANAH
jgi:hypothetical protein